jgi:alkenylglycerophosphocholine/alkenylglycerophosphoethanolamine hydrolase
MWGAGQATAGPPHRFERGSFPAEMTATAWIVLGAAAIFAAGDLVAVVRENKPLEYATKPTVMVLLIVLAVVLHPTNAGERAWFVVALVLGLVGDVFLMLPGDLLVPGIAAFLAGHLAYIAGFRAGPFSAAGAVVGAAIAGASVAFLMPRVISGLARSGRTSLTVPVIAYVAVISLMAVSSTASGSVVAAAGGLLFFFSDGVLAWYRFVNPVRWGLPVNIVMYQAGQALLVLSLAR